MPRLTDIEIRALKPREKPYKAPDGDGLYLLVQPSGSRLWRFKYRYGGSEKLLAFGRYPEVPLKLARQRLADARELLAAGTDPSAERREQKAVAEHTLRRVAEKWLAAQSGAGKVSGPTVAAMEARLIKYIYPKLGERPIGQIGVAELGQCLERIAEYGTVETAHRTKSLCSRIFRYAMARELCVTDPTIAMRELLPPAQVEHFKTLHDPDQVGELLHRIDHCRSDQPQLRIALRLTPYLFQRPGELRNATWDQFDLERAEWRIPGENMKAGDPHIVPLPRQAVELLHALETFTGDGRYLFPSALDRSKPFSDGTINKMIRDLGSSSRTARGTKPERPTRGPSD
jgi:integrase